MSTGSQDNSVLDCKRFSGRKRAICEGASGLSAEIEEQYRRKWAANQKPRGFGDTVKDWIDKYVPDCLKPKKDCGCKKRQEWLNNVFPYGTEGGEKLD